MCGVRFRPEADLGRSASEDLTQAGLSCSGQKQNSVKLQPSQAATGDSSRANHISGREIAEFSTALCSDCAVPKSKSAGATAMQLSGRLGWKLGITAGRGRPGSSGTRHRAPATVSARDASHSARGTHDCRSGRVRKHPDRTSGRGDWLSTAGSGEGEPMMLRHDRSRSSNAGSHSGLNTQAGCSLISSARHHFQSVIVAFSSSVQPSRRMAGCAGA